MLVASSISSANALELDWSGQFRAENHFITNYANSQSATGYGVVSGGSDNASFQSLFLRMRPKVVVNDNVYVKSEWWAGDPVYGMFGDAAPYGTDGRQYYSTQSRGSFITAQRFWAEILTDLGVVRLGRMPLNWGLGLIYNGGDGVFDRYVSTGDAISMSAKVGSITFAPSFIKYSMGNSVGGNRNVTAGTLGGTPPSGHGNVSDYSFLLRYENLDEDLDIGVNLIRRNIDAAQDTTSGYLGVTGVPAGSGITIWDIYAKKKLGKVTVAAELPLASGNIGGVPYSTKAVAGEVQFKATSHWDLSAKVGSAPGQSNQASATNPSGFGGFFFHPNYRVGMIMFGYQLGALGGMQSQNNPTATANNLSSPFDNPITNATYISLGTQFGFGASDRWRMRLNFLTASAQQVAAAGSAYFNTWSRKFENNVSGATQGSDLGTEYDLGVSYQLDENLQVAFDMGLFFPGTYYAFSNGGVSNARNTVFANAIRVGINF
ncbi:MAG: hypothetical protein JNL01_06240 [Bdellovibrionales bacterium]|nr:hypothetical protein [Bdellovibrionales bacterium]